MKNQRGKNKKNAGLIKESKNNTQDNPFLTGVSFMAGAIVLILLFIWIFQPKLILTGEITPSINIQPSITEPTEGFCPQVSDIVISSEDNTIFQFKEYKQGEYSFGGNALSFCRIGSLEGENIHYVYCPIILNRIDESGQIISHDMIIVEIEPKTKEVLSVRC